MAKCQKFWVWGTQKFQKTFFAQNHSIRENKVKKVKKDENIFFFSFPTVLSDLTLRGRKPTFSICRIIYRLVLTFGC